MSTGSGDEWYCLFNLAGAVLKGFDHESPMSPWASDERAVWKGVLDQVPRVFQSSLKEPAFDIDNTTFCLWRRHEDHVWHGGRIEFPDGSKDPDGSAWMLELLDGEPASYKRWASEYYERPVSLNAVQRVYSHQALTESLARELNPSVQFEALLADAAQIGYPAV